MLLLETLSDEELQKLAAGGDADAEELLFRRYNRIIQSLARPFFLTGGDEGDLLQEGMLGLLNAIRHYDPGEKTLFRTFAVLCIRRRLYSALRNSDGSNSISLDECLSLESSLFDENPSRNDSVRSEDELIDREEARKRYESLLARLSPLERSVLRCFLRGMSYREIAEYTHKSEKAVDNAIQRIRRKLKELIQAISASADANTGRETKIVKSED